MDQSRDLGNVFLEHADRVGVGHHHGGDRAVESGPQVVDVYSAVGEASDLDNLEAGDGGRGWVGAVGRVGHEHGVASSILPREMICLDHQQSGQLAVGAGKGIEGELGHAADLAEGALQLPIDGKSALRRGSRLHRVERGDRARGRKSVVDLGVIFHSARPERVESCVDTEVVGA